MTVTRTPRLGLVRWSSDEDPWSREDLVESIDQLEAAALRREVNVQDPEFGAAGDGVTDDTAAINAALEAIANGGTVYFPPGTYVSGAIRLRTRQRLRGAGLASRLTAAPGLAAHFIALTDVNVSHTKIESLWITCDAQAAGFDAVNLYNWGGTFIVGNDPYHVIEDTIVTGGARNNISVGAGARETRLLNVVTKNARGGSCLLVACTDSVFEAVTAASGPSGFAQILVVDGANRFVNCKSFYAGAGGSTSDGYRIDSGYNVFVGCEAQDNGRHGFHITGQTTDVVLAGCRAHGNYDTNLMVANTGANPVVDRIVVDGIQAGYLSGATRFDSAYGIQLLGTPPGVVLTGSAEGVAGHVNGTPGPRSSVAVTTPAGLVDHTTGNVLVGSPTEAASVLVQGPAGSARDLILMTGGVSRWTLRADTGAETGSDAGSDFLLLARNDAGGLIDDSLRAFRKTANVRVKRTLMVGALADATAGGLVGGLHIGNAATAPTGNPGSGAVVYAEGDALKVRNKAGDTLSLAAGVLAVSGDVTVNGGKSVATDEDLAAHVTDTTGAHAATAISYAGSAGLSATDVEAALDELDTEKAPKAAPTFTGLTTVADLTATGTVRLGDAATDLVGFFGAAPVARPGTYNLTGAAVDRTLGAYSSNPESSAYPGNPAALTDAARNTDLEALRVAYENLRTYTEDLAGIVAGTVTDLKALGLLG